MSIVRNLIIALLLAGFLLIQTAAAEPTEPVGTASDQESGSAYDDIELFTDVLAIIQHSYVEKIDMRDLIYGGIRGMLATLDPHSSFMTPELYEEMQADTQGEFGGVGIEVTLDQGLLAVVSPIDGTPASRAGIKARDQIVRINGNATQDLNLMEAVRMMRGAIGEKISLQIRREGVEKLLDFDLVREVIQVHSVSGRTLEPGYGYVRITQFQERTGQDLKEMVTRIRQENQASFHGLILDLRNNPGGLLDQAVEVSDLFLRKGLIVYTEGRDNENQLRFHAVEGGTEPEYPLILLINEGSASASEIVAGALHDHGRALLLGENTFGKGSVQTIIPLSDHSGLRLTTARYFTPSGTSIQARGISPDIEVLQLALPPAPPTGHYREKDLENHFEAQGSSPKPLKKLVSDSDQAHDYQLMRALDLLKGVDFFEQIKHPKTL